MRYQLQKRYQPSGMTRPASFVCPQVSKATDGIVSLGWRSPNHQG